MLMKTLNMKSVKIYYTQKGISGYSYYFDKKLTKQNYDENGNFTVREEVEPELKYYTLVGKHTLDIADNDEVFRWVILNYNVGDIPAKIARQNLDVSHTCFSAGDIVEIDGIYYISGGAGFQKIWT